MGLASKLQASPGAGGPGMMMGAPPPGAATPGAQMPVFPPGGSGAAGSAPSAPPAPYGQQPPPGIMAAGGPGGMMMGGPPTAGLGGAPASPYPPGAFSGYSPAGAPPLAPYSQPPQPQQQQQQPAGFGGPQQQGFPPHYPGAAPPGMPGAPGGMPMMQQQPGQQQHQGPPYPMGAPPGGGPLPGGMSMMHQQQQVQGMPQPTGGTPGGMAGQILAKLSSIVAANQLQRFYPPHNLQALAARLDARVNFRDLAARWRMPVELALDLASLALYDIILFADDSGSMAFEENGERIEDLKLIGSKVAEIATLFDDDGILVRFMNSNTEGNAVRSAADVGALLAGMQYSGLTPLATSLAAKVLQPIVYSLAASGHLAKPVLVLTITDGEPTDNPRDLVVQVVKDARNRLAAQYGPKAVAFEFAQVGKDQRAQAFLGQLDKHPEVGNSIDCTSYFELESAEYQQRGIQLSPELWLVKMMVGSIDPTYDEGDE